MKVFPLKFDYLREIENELKIILNILNKVFNKIVCKAQQAHHLPGLVVLLMMMLRKMIYFAFRLYIYSTSSRFAIQLKTIHQHVEFRFSMEMLENEPHKTESMI